MLANTLALTIGTDAAITLTRIREDSGSSIYRYRVAGREVVLTLRQNSQKSGTKVFNVYNASLSDTIAPTVADPLGKSYTSSMTGRFEALGDPVRATDISKGTNVLLATIMSSLANGEV